MSPYPLGETGLSDIMRVLKRRSGALIGGTLVVFGLAALITMLLPKTYESSVTLLFESSEQENAGALAVLERMGQTGTVDTELGMVTSRSVLEPVVRDLNLHIRVKEDGTRGEATPESALDSFSVSGVLAPGTYVANSSRRARYAIYEKNVDTVLVQAPPDSTIQVAGLTFRIRPGTDDLEIRVLPITEAVSELQADLSVSTVGRDAQFVELRCRGPRPRDLQQVCDRVAESFLRVRASLDQSQASSAATFLKSQADVVGRQLAAAEDSLGNFEASNRAVALEETAREEVRQYAQLNAERMQLAAERAALNQLIGDIENASGGEDTGRYRDLASFPTFLRSNSQGVSGLMEQLVELETQRSDLRLRRSDTSADVVQLNSRIADIESQLRTFAGSYEDALGAQIRSLDGSLASARQTLSTIPERQLEVERLRRKADISADLFRLLQARLQEAQVATAMASPGIRVVDRASLAFAPVSPNVPMNLAVALLLGLAFGGGLALFREETDQTVKEREDLQRFEAPILGLLPQLKRGGPVLPINLPVPALDNGAHRKRSVLGGILGDDSGPIEAPLVPSVQEEIALEAFRSLVTDLRFLRSRGDYEGLKVITLTSAARGDGKTYTSSNLALAHADAGFKTLLIDGDVRAKGVGRFFGIPLNTKGLTEAVRSGSHYRDFVVPVDVDHRVGLDVLPAGALGTEGTHQIASDGLGALVARAAQEYDMVLIDAPPLTLLADAAYLAAAAEGTLLVVREGKTEQQALDLCFQRLDRAGATLLGTVLNGSKLPGYYRAYAYVTEP